MKALLILIMMFSFTLMTACNDVGSNEPTITSNGVGGSTAKFVVQLGHLITVESELIKVFDLADPSAPVLVNSYEFDRRAIIETVFPYQSNRLLFGTSDGVAIIDHSTPGTLEQVSFATHITSCDPVVAQGNYMYVTLRDGRDCETIFGGAGVNQLMVYDITDDTQPSLEFTLNMDQPWGLGLNGNTLFVCYASGLKEFDISDPVNPEEVADYSVQCDDIIATTSPLILTGEGGIRLMESDGMNLTELSSIQVGD